jgi:hypothetical protein
MKQTYPIPHCGTLLARFNRLIEEVLHGNVRQKSFKLWEADILLDIMRCQLEGEAMPDLLRRYQKAVQLQMMSGPGLPLKLSEYLQAERTNGAKTMSAAPMRVLRPEVTEHQPIARQRHARKAG